MVTPQSQYDRNNVNATTIMSVMPICSVDRVRTIQCS